MIRVLLAAVLVAVLTVAASAERRVALVMSADDYRLIRPLANAGHDGEAMQAALKELGFEVFLETNRDLRRMRRALEDFREDAKGADVALVFFSGHGVEISGENRLLPIDADASSLEALEKTSLPLEEAREMVAATAKVGLIVLDACRNDPFGGASGSGRGVVALTEAKDAAVRPGLGRVGRAENILFAFSAAPGETASDGTEHNSPFSTALIKYLGTDGLEIRSVLTLVQQEVYERSAGQQLPYVESGLPKLFFASTTPEQLPERERLLLAMADVTPAIRDEVERIAATRGMPLAPLYGALISSGSAELSPDQRSRKLAEAADAFVRVREEMRSLASTDPQVAQLRQQAEQQLSLGAFDAARAKLTEAAGIDRQSRHALKSNFTERTLSEATTHYLNGGAAHAELHYELAIGDYEKAAAVYAEVESEQIAPELRFQHLSILRAIGDLEVTVGNLTKAGAAYEALSGASSRAASADPSNPNWQNSLSISYEKRGDVSLAQGNLPDARALYEAGLEILTRLAADYPTYIGWQSQLSVNRSRIGDVQAAQGDLAAALQSYHAALGLMSRVAATEPGNPDWTREVAIANGKIGDLEMAQGHLLFALAAYQAGLDAWTGLIAITPANGLWQRDLSAINGRIGSVRFAQGDLTSALNSYRASLDISKRLAAIDPGNAELQRDISVGHNKIGDIFAARGNLADGLRAYQEGLEIARRLADTDPHNAGWQRDVEISYNRVGDMLVRQNELARAADAYQNGKDIASSLSASDAGNLIWQRDLSISHEKIGDVRLVRSDFSGALEAYRASLDIRTRLVDADALNASWRHDLSVSQEKVGDVFLARHDLPAALSAYKASLDIREQLAAVDPRNAGWQTDLAFIYARIGDLLAAQGDRVGAITSHRASLYIRGRLVSTDPENVEAQWDLFVSYWSLGSLEAQPAESLTRALEILERLNAKGSLAPSRVVWIATVRDRLEHTPMASDNAEK